MYILSHSKHLHSNWLKYIFVQNYCLKIGEFSQEITLELGKKWTIMGK